MRKKLVYLVRSDQGILIEFKRPKGVRILKNNWWSVRGFQRVIGVPGDFLCAEGWTGPIGVYDISRPDHVRSMLEQAINHEHEISANRLQTELEEVFGFGLVLQAMRKRSINEGKTLKEKEYLSPKQYLYLRTKDAVYKILLERVEIRN